MSCICRETCTGWEWQSPHLPATLWAPFLTHFFPNLLLLLGLFHVTAVVPEPVKQGPCLFCVKGPPLSAGGKGSRYSSSSFLVGTLSEDVTQGYVKDRGHTGVVLVMEALLPPSQGQIGLRRKGKGGQQEGQGHVKTVGESRVCWSWMGRWWWNRNYCMPGPGWTCGLYPSDTTDITTGRTGSPLASLLVLTAYVSTHGPPMRAETLRGWGEAGTGSTDCAGENKSLTWIQDKEKGLGRSSVLETESILMDRTSPSPLVQKVHISWYGLFWRNGNTLSRLLSGLCFKN